MYIISKCLLGYNCKYNGGNNETEWVKEFCKTHSYRSVCPEEAGGLPTPREPAERAGDKVFSASGENISQAFLRGGLLCYAECLMKTLLTGDEIEGAILKSKSPSCGKGEIYDGTFSGTLIEGDGVFAQILKSRNIDIYTEKERIE